MNTITELTGEFLSSIFAPTYISALEVIFNVMHSVNSRFTYLLLLYLLTCLLAHPAACDGGFMCLGGVVVSALGMRTWRPRFEFRVVLLFRWVATLGKLFTHIASPVSQLQETGVQKEFSAPKWLW